MGCEVALPFGAPVEQVRALFDERDRRFSRFNPSSELNRVNGSPLGLTLVSEEFASMLGLSLDAARATDGLSTPTVGGAIVAAGSDRDVDRHPADVGAVEPAPVPSFHAVSVRGRGVLRTEPVVLDLNGVVKSRTVDDALALVGSGWVFAGGDVATREPVVIGLPGGGTVALHGGGIATASLARRRRLPSDVPRSHLIDPRTGRRATSPWRDVTVAAATCLRANVAARAALLLGHGGPDWLDGRGLAGRFVGHDGRVRANDAWRTRGAGALAA
jgi:thiamine biosynthesis lipoprotein